jgi:hypothetical protein
MQTELQTQMIGYFFKQCNNFTNLFKKGGNAKLQKVLGSELYYKQCGKYWTYKLTKINAMSVDELNNLNYLVRYAIELKLYGKMSLKQFVESRFAIYYQSADCDRYGQLNTVDVHSIFPTNIVYSTQDCVNYLVKNDIVNVNTYGYTYGTYKGFSPWYIKNAKIKQICEDAYAKNPSRKNCNNW